MTGTFFFLKTITAKHLLAHVSLQCTPLRSQHFFFPTFWKHPDALFKKGLWLVAYPLANSLDNGVVVRKPLSEALTPLKHTGPWETLFPILLLESVVNFSGRDVFSTRNLITMRCSTLPDRTEQVLTQAGGRVEVVAPLSQGRIAAAQCGLFTHKLVPVIFVPPCTIGTICCWFYCTSSKFKDEHTILVFKWKLAH
jgi:hypothetical protein